MNVNRRTLAFFVAISCLSGTSLASADEPAEMPTENAAEKPKLLVTISKETTYITEPLRADGYVDYLAATNAKAREGVTLENNAAVLFWQAVGAGELSDKYRDRYFEMLGVDPPAKDGDYFVAHDDFLGADRLSDEQWETLDEQFFEALGRPWTKKEFPEIGRWLDENEKPMKLLVEASKRPRRYDPVITGEGEDSMLIAALLPSIQTYREVCRAFMARAMLRLGEGKVEEAWSDLMACHRLGRLSGQGATLIDGLVGFAIDGMALKGDRAVLQSGGLSSKQAMKMRNELLKLQPVEKMAVKIDSGERLMYLDGTCYLAREGVDELTTLAGGAPGETEGIMSSLMKTASGKAIDWDIVLRMGNSWYDKLVDAASKPTRAERKIAFDKFDAELEELAKSATDKKKLAWDLLANPRKAVSERIGEIMISLMIPAVSRVCEMEDRAAANFEVTSLGFALAAYRADNGEYPKKLSMLSPKYLKEIPQDIFADGPLKYKRKDDGYLLYSIGPNETDDRGRNSQDLDWEDPNHDKGWDDIAVEVSGKK